MNTNQELKSFTRIYLALIVLSLASVFASSLGHPGRVAAILVALGIAWAKAGLISYYFMHLKSARPLVWVIVFIAILAVAILAVGVLPDLAIYYR